MTSLRFRAMKRATPLALFSLLLAASPQSANQSSKPAAGVGPAAAQPRAAGNANTERSNRHYVTLRGEIVDYYCYIEKGLTGRTHRDCGIRCVAGDICMGLLTADGDLYMISRNHMRAMEPLAFKSVPDPFNTCTGWIAEKVDLSGHAMERKGQRIIEITDVKKAVGDPPAKSQ